MQKRKLSSSNLEVSAIGFGRMGMRFDYGPAADAPAVVSHSVRTIFIRSSILPTRSCSLRLSGSALTEHQVSFFF